MPAFYLKNIYIQLDGKTKYSYIYYNPPASQNAGKYFELPGSGQGLSSQPEAYEHDGGNTLYNSAAGF
ncbi:hypothetical protein E5N38_25185 [Escherichia coli]|nr:hypothetical protein [Escherichia coli]